MILKAKAGEEPAGVLAHARQASPASPDTEPRPAGPSTEPGSCRSGRVRSAGACKRQTQRHPIPPSASAGAQRWVRASLEEAGEILGGGVAAGPAAEAAHEQDAALRRNSGGHTS